MKHSLKWVYFILVTLFLLLFTADYSADSPALNTHSFFQKSLFIDTNLDGYNDLASDLDGNGIPDGMQIHFASGTGTLTKIKVGDEHTLTDAASKM